MSVLRLHLAVLGLSILVLCTPRVTYAAILINEIAWMGTSGDGGSYCEWIEFKNTGDVAVSLTGWTFVIGSTEKALADGTGGSLTVGAGDLFVLERDTTGCADPVPNVTDWKISFGTGISNSGVTLALKRTDGSIEDQVVGGDNWTELGGSNTTKETAQYTGSGWITATATPGTNNTTVDSGSSDSDTESSQNDTGDDTGADSGNTTTGTSSKSTQSTGANVARVSLSPDDALSLKLVYTKRAYVNSPVLFTAVPSGIEDSLLRTLTYRWNFGDGTVSSDRTPLHTYTHAGTYVVVCVAERNNHEAVVRSEITILPLMVSLGQTPDGILILHNDAPYEIDVSGVVISDGVHTFVMPEHSYVSAHGSLMLDSVRTGFSPYLTQAFVFDGYGTKLATYPKPPETLLAESFVGDTTVSADSISATASDEGDGLVATQEPIEEDIQLSSDDVPPSQTQQFAQAVSASDTDKGSFIDSISKTVAKRAPFALIGILIVSITALYVHRLV